MGSSSSQFLKQRYDTIKIIWINHGSTHDQYEKFNNQFQLIKCQTIQQGFKYISQFSEIDRFAVVCQGSLSEVLLAKIDEKPKLKIDLFFIYCMEPKNYEKLLQNKKLKAIYTDQQLLCLAINNSINSPSSLPAFRALQQGQQQSDKYQNLSKDLSYIINTVDQSQTIRAILAKQLTQTLKIYISGPHNNQIVYPKKGNHEAILNLHSSSRIYRYITNSISTHILSHLSKAQIYISDLFQAIKKASTYEHRSSISESVFYSGGYYTKEDLQRFKLMVGQDIQFLGFLQALQNQDDAKSITKNVFFIIYMPEFFKNKKYSMFYLEKGYVKLQSSRLILFNLKSIMKFLRFHQANGVSYFQFIYGLNQIRRFIKINESQNMMRMHDKKRGEFPNNCSCKPLNHLVSTVNNNKIICLKNIMKTNCLQQSFIYMNPKSKNIQGFNIEYSSHVQNRMMQEYQKCQITGCTKCVSIIKCSQCIQAFCLCNIQLHKHLASGILLIEGPTPRFLSIPNQQKTIRIYQSYKNSMSQVTQLSGKILMKNRPECKDNLSLKIKPQQYLDRAITQFQHSLQIGQTSFKQSLENLNNCINANVNYPNYHQLVQAYLYKGIIQKKLKLEKEAALSIENAKKAIQQIQNKQQKLSSDEKLTKNTIQSLLFEYKKNTQCQQQISESLGSIESQVNKNRNRVPFEEQNYILSAQSCINNKKKKQEIKLSNNIQTYLDFQSEKQLSEKTIKQSNNQRCLNVEDF